MESLINIRPRLIEPGVKYFMSSTLEKCNNFKCRYYNFLYNLGLLLLFILIIGITLYFKYKRKHNLKLNEENKKKEKEYLLNKLRFIKDYKKNQMNHIMSDLSNWQNNPEVQFYNRKILT
jgi:type II secretory pathway component PulF